MKEIQYRHEYKSVINYADYYSLRPRLAAVSKLDPHANEQGRYHIRSLYFDNENDKALKEKLEGYSQREKFRLRLYNQDTSFIRLEKKIKRSHLGNKRSVRLTADEVTQLLDGDYANFPKTRTSAPNPDAQHTSASRPPTAAPTDDALLLEFYAKLFYQHLRPKTVVEYWREAHIYPHGNVRVTFDFDVRSGLYTQDFLAPDLPGLQTMDSGLLILEVKYDRFLPDLIRDLIQSETRRPQAFSKYAACRLYE